MNQLTSEMNYDAIPFNSRTKRIGSSNTLNVALAIARKKLAIIQELARALEPEDRKMIIDAAERLCICNSKFGDFIQNDGNCRLYKNCFGCGRKIQRKDAWMLVACHVGDEPCHSRCQRAAELLVKTRLADLEASEAVEDLREGSEKRQTVRRAMKIARGKILLINRIAVALQMSDYPGIVSSSEDLCGIKITIVPTNQLPK
jgi:hypothetical protein